MSVPLAVSLLTAALSSTEAAPVQVYQQDHLASIENRLLRIDYDLARGTWSAADKRRGRMILSAASSRVDQFLSTAEGASRTFVAEPLSDALGMGQSLLVTTVVPGGPKLLLRISLYDNAGFIALAAGLENTTGQVIHLKEICPLQADAFTGFDTQSGYHTLDGFSGGAKTYVAHDWNAAQHKLQGVSAVVGGEPYRVIVAANGKKAVKAAIDDSIEHSVANSRRGPVKSPTTAELRKLSDSAGLVELTITRPDNGPVAWNIAFEER